MKIVNKQQLRELYGFPSGRAKEKEFSSLDKHALRFIEKSPFVVISTSNKQGQLDASPRGGSPGFIKAINQNEIVIPDAKGNNCVDSIGNIIETGAIGMLFLIPGVDETLRVNGNGYLSTDSNYLELFDSEKNPPKACIVITVKEMFLHCAKAFMRSKLWHEDSKIKRTELPTMGEMLKDQLHASEPAKSHQDMVKRYQKDL